MGVRPDLLPASSAAEAVFGDVQGLILEHPVELIGKELRAMMPWLESTT